MCNGVLHPVHCVFYGAEGTCNVHWYGAARLQQRLQRVYTLYGVGYPGVWEHVKEEGSPLY